MNELGNLIHIWLQERPSLPWHVVENDDFGIDGIWLDKNKDGITSNYCFLLSDLELSLEVSLMDQETGPYSETVTAIDAHDPGFFQKLEALLIFALPYRRPITPDWTDGVSDDHGLGYCYDREETREDYLARY